MKIGEFIKRKDWQNVIWLLAIGMTNFFGFYKFYHWNGSFE